MIIKQIPEDFIVVEVPDRQWLSQGRFLVVNVTKRLRSSDDVARDLAVKVGVKEVSYAGNKDVFALTSQFMAIRGLGRKRIGDVSVRDVRIEPVGFCDEPLSLGSLRGNRFGITVRDLDKPLLSVNRVPNFFGPQRFGQNNVAIGLALLKGEFASACELIAHEGGKQQELLKNALAKDPKNVVGALRMIPRKVLLLYVHAYQSHLFNLLLADALKAMTVEQLSEISFPLAGFDTALSPELSALLEKDSLTLRSFIIRSLPDLTCEGSTRKAVVEVKDFSLGELETDDLFPGRKKCLVSFFLEKGAYATTVLKYLEPE